MITFKKLDEVYSRVIADSGIVYELSEAFERFVPNYRHMKAFKSGSWNGKKSFIHKQNGKFYSGLLKDIWQECKSRGYNEFKFEGYDKSTPYTKESIIERLNGFVLPPDKPLRDYQIEAIVECLTKKRRIILSATSSGKSLIIYCISRILVEDGYKIVLMVPSVMLVNQMISDFKEYAENDTYDIDEFHHKVYAGQDKFVEKQVVVTTWQSLNAIADNSLKKSFLEEFDVVINDEVHTADAKVLGGLLELTTNASFRFGFTGTLGEESKSMKESLVGLFGKDIRVNTTRELMDRGQIATLDIKSIILSYPDHIRKLTYKMEYKDELDTIIGYENRNKFIVKLCRSLKGNTLILFRFVEKHGKILRDLLEKETGKKVFLITAETDDDIRSDIKAELETLEDAIILGSYGLLSTGVSIVNLRYLIAASPTKSKIRILQSIGRILRKNDAKTHATFFDLVDDLTWKNERNYAMNHYKIRHDYYIAEDFEVTISHANLR